MLPFALRPLLRKAALLALATPLFATPPAARAPRVGCLSGIWLCLTGLLAATGDSKAGTPPIQVLLPDPQAATLARLDQAFDHLDVLRAQWELALVPVGPEGPDFQLVGERMAEHNAAFKKMLDELEDLRTVRRRPQPKAD